MEVQSQTISTNVPAGGTTGVSAATSGNGNANGVQSQGAFSITLNSMMSGGTGQETAVSTAGLSGIPAIIQLLMPLLSAASATEVQASSLTADQVDALTALLQEPGQAESLLSNPDLQAWLMQLQALLAVIAPTPISIQDEAASLPTDAVEQSGEEGTTGTLSTLLFIPIQSTEQTPADANAAPHDQMNTEAANSTLNHLLLTPVQRSGQTESANGTAQLSIPQEQAITPAQALHLLKQLKSLIQTAQNDPKLKQVLKELPSVLVSAAVETGDIHKAIAAAPRLTQIVSQVKPSMDSETSAAADLVQVVPNKLQKLEIMAAKTVTAAPNLSFETQAPSGDEPLFVPLTDTDLSGQNAQPITVQEFLKQVQTGHPVKMPVLHMPAASFSDDMTQFVVSSFMLESSAQGFTEAKISLYPQHLGHVDVKLTMQNGQLVAQFVADSMAGKEMLESQLSQLRSTLQSQGIQVEKLEVSQGQGFQSGMFQEGRQQQSGQSSKQQKSASGRIAALDEVVLEDAGETAAAGTTTVNGSIDVTA